MTFKRIIIALTAVVCCHNISAQALEEPITRDWVKFNYQKREVNVKMRDGVRLFTCIYEPIDKGVTHPILMTRTCYGSAPYGEEYMDLTTVAWADYVRRGYILVFQDVRGKNMSEGTFADMRPMTERGGKMRPTRDKEQTTDETTDAWDTTEWLLRHTNNNGCVGLTGISYPGFYAMMGALSGHPAIKAVSPQAPTTDWFRGDDDHHGGAMCLMDMFSFEYWFQYLNTAAIKTGEKEYADYVNPSEIVKNDIYNDHLKVKTLSNFSRLLGDSLDFWTATMEHPNLDSWWERRNTVYHMHDVKPATLIVGGLFDAEDCYGAFATYKAIRTLSPKTELYLVEGPWAHGTWVRMDEKFLGDTYLGDSIGARFYMKHIEVPFFDYYLRGKGKKPRTGAMVFHTGENHWHHYPEGWKEMGKPINFYLNADGTLTREQKPSNDMTSYVSDPAHPVPFKAAFDKGRNVEDLNADQRFASSRTDVATWCSDVLTEPLRIAGEVEAELNVSITTTDADFVVKLIDVYPDGFCYTDSIESMRYYGHNNMSGYEMLVRGEIVRGKYRNTLGHLEENLSQVTDQNGRWSNELLEAYYARLDSAVKAEPFVPGETTRVKVVLPDVAHTFLPGHKMMVMIQSSSFPRFDLNPQRFCDIYHCKEDDFQKSTISFSHTKEQPSMIRMREIGNFGAR